MNCMESRPVKVPARVAFAAAAPRLLAMASSATWLRISDSSVVVSAVEMISSSASTVYFHADSMSMRWLSA